MTPVTLARDAMATRFEIVLQGEDPVRLRAAGEEALDEIDRLEAQLSLYRPSSEISALNALAARGPVRVSPETFRLLKQAARLSAETNGAFDITVAPLVRAWGFMNGHGALADAAQLAAARACVGMHLVEFDRPASTVRFLRPGVMLDLGAIGKGYAVDRAAEILRETGVKSALIHSGTSTAYAVGHPQDAEKWKVGVEYPRTSPDVSPPLLATVELCDESLSMSAVWGKAFQAGGRRYGHVLDPRAGEPVQAALLAVVVGPTATETDALSTALLTLGPAGLEVMASLRPGLRALVLADGNSPGAYRVEARGITVLPST